MTYQYTRYRNYNGGRVFLSDLYPGNCFIPLFVCLKEVLVEIGTGKLRFKSTVNYNQTCDKDYLEWKTMFYVPE